MIIHMFRSGPCEHDASSTNNTITTTHNAITNTNKNTKTNANANAHAKYNRETNTDTNINVEGNKKTNGTWGNYNPEQAEVIQHIKNIQNKIHKNINKLRMSGDMFDSSKGFLGEGPISMTLTAKFFLCPTIMGKTWVKAVMNKTKATITINQMRILRSTSKFKNAKKKDGNPKPRESLEDRLLPYYNAGTRIEIRKEKKIPKQKTHVWSIE